MAGSRVVAPHNFKRIFSDFKPQFAGWKQQDAQEFLSMFLAGLSHSQVDSVIEYVYRDNVKNDLYIHTYIYIYTYIYIHIYIYISRGKS